MSWGFLLFQKDPPIDHLPLSHGLRGERVRVSGVIMLIVYGRFDRASVTFPKKKAIACLLYPPYDNNKTILAPLTSRGDAGVAPKHELNKNSRRNDYDRHPVR
jgi:hypothetical protein